MIIIIVDILAITFAAILSYFTVLGYLDEPFQKFIKFIIIRIAKKDD
jgi:hypothetical protein